MVRLRSTRSCATNGEFMAVKITLRLKCIATSPASVKSLRFEMPPPVQARQSRSEALEVNDDKLSNIGNQLINNDNKFSNNYHYVPNNYNQNHTNHFNNLNNIGNQGSNYYFSNDNILKNNNQAYNGIYKDIITSENISIINKNHSKNNTIDEYYGKNNNSDGYSNHNQNTNQLHSLNIIDHYKQNQISNRRNNTYKNTLDLNAY